MQLDRCLAVTILSKQPSSDQKHPNLTVNLSGFAIAPCALHHIRKRISDWLCHYATLYMASPSISDISLKWKRLLPVPRCF